MSEERMFNVIGELVHGLKRIINDDNLDAQFYAKKTLEEACRVDGTLFVNCGLSLVSQAERLHRAKNPKDWDNIP